MTMGYVHWMIFTTILFCISLVVIFYLITRRNNLQKFKAAQEEAYQRALEEARKQEEAERLELARKGHIPTILYLAKEAEGTDVHLALSWYEKAALSGDKQGMYDIIRLAETLKFDSNMRDKASYWRYKVQSLEGDRMAKLRQGYCLIDGRGITMDVTKGVALVEEVANYGELEAMLYLGAWYAKEGPYREPETSTYWYRKASDLNSHEGRLKLGTHYLEGFGVERSFCKGIYWIERVAEEANIDGMNMAGERWVEHHASHPKQHGKYFAYIWYYLASYLGNDEVVLTRDKIGGDLGVEVVVSLQKLVRPILTKMQKHGKVPEHYIIKILNRLFQRETYFPHEDPELLPQKVVEVTPETDSKEVEYNVFKDVKPWSDTVLSEEEMKFDYDYTPPSR